MDVSRRRFLVGGGVVGSVTVSGCSQILEKKSENRSKTTPATVEITEHRIDKTEFTLGGSTTVAVQVVNEDTDAGELDVTLRLDDEDVRTETITLDSETEQTLTFELSVETPGTYEVTVNNQYVGGLVVHGDQSNPVRDVCAHYYPWYGAPAHSWRGGEWSLESPSTPVLGNYNSTDSAVIEQHIDWCHRASVTWLNVSWWGPDSHEDDRLQNVLLEHPRAEELQWSILYETPGRLGSGSIDLNADQNRQQLRTDFEYLAETYFERDEYKRIDERPVLYMWIANTLDGDIEEAYETAVDAAGIRPYLIADIPETEALDISPVTDVADAVTTYNPYAAQDNIENVFLERMESAYNTWHRAAQYVDIDIIPTTIPGFDDTELTHDQRDNPPLVSSPDRYERAAEMTRRYADGPVFVTSFNEWYEDTQIEPSEEYGGAYLDITADILATKVADPPELDNTMCALTFDRTIPESEMSPDVEEGRDLAMLVSRLVVRDGQGERVVDVDVGSNEEELEFLLGTFSKERNGENSWRWLGGSETTVLETPDLPESGELELLGRGAAAMNVSLQVSGDEIGRGQIDTDYDWHVVDFG